MKLRIILLVAVVIAFSASVGLEFLNLRHTLTHPADNERDDKAQQYTKDKTILRVTLYVINFALSMGLWFGGGFESFEKLIAPLVPRTYVGSAYVVGLMLINYVISLPFGYYSTFTIDGDPKYNFNQTSRSQFVQEAFLSIATIMFIGTVSVQMFLKVWNSHPYSWLVIWFGMCSLMLLMQMNSKIGLSSDLSIRPLTDLTFNGKYDDLHSSIMCFTRQLNFDIENVFILNAGIQSRKSNAFFTGFGKHKKIVLFDTLLNHHTHAEILAIIAHEIGHYKYKHIQTGVITAVLYSFVMLFALSLVSRSKTVADIFFIKNPSIHKTLMFVGILAMPLELPLSTAMMTNSRKHEFEADDYAKTVIDSDSNNPDSVKAVAHAKQAMQECCTNQSNVRADCSNKFPDVTDLVCALKNLGAANLSNPNPHPWYVTTHYSHPPMEQRINQLTVDGKEQCCKNVWSCIDEVGSISTTAVLIEDKSSGNMSCSNTAIAELQRGCP